MDVPLFKQGVEDYSSIIVKEEESREEDVESRDMGISYDCFSKDGSSSYRSERESETEDTVKLCYDNGKCVFYYCKWSTKTSEVYKYFMRSRFKTLTDELRSQYVLVRAKDPNTVLSLSRSIRDNGFENGDIVVRRERALNSP